MSKTIKGRVIAWSPHRDDSLGLDAANWARANGLHVSAVVAEETLSIGPRTTTTRQILAELDKAGELGAIVTRSEPFHHPEMPELRAELERAGVRFLTLADVIAPIPRSEIPRPLAGLPVSVRLLRGREAGARAGFHQSGPAPYGYMREYVRHDERRGGKVRAPVLVTHPEEAETIRLIFRTYLALRSMKKTIALLNESGSRTRRRKRWSRAGIAWILKNSTYLGRVHFGQIRVKGHHPAIISPIVFNKVQKLIAKNNKRNAKALKH